MIAFKGHLSFRQYMPAKPPKYGIKADACNGFMLNHKVYLGRERNAAPENGLGYNVVTPLRAVGFSYAKRERNYFEQPSAFPSSMREFVAAHVMHLMSISLVN